MSPPVTPGRRFATWAIFLLGLSRNFFQSTAELLAVAIEVLRHPGWKRFPGSGVWSYSSAPAKGIDDMSPCVHFLVAPGYRVWGFDETHTLLNCWGLGVFFLVCYEA